MSVKEAGVREIPVRRTLIYRDREDNGHKVFGPELERWEDCIHRFDMHRDK